MPTLTYTTMNSVKVRLSQKVKFQLKPDQIQQGELPDELLNQVISDTETEVEQKLRGRYAVPFRSKTTNSWDGLPDHSKRAIRTAVDYLCVVNVLAMDFGRGGRVDAESLIAEQKAKFDLYIDELLGQDAEGKLKGRFRYAPPLDDMLLAFSNQMADDGFKGMIQNTDPSELDAVTYAAEQIDDPSTSYIGSRKGGVIR